MAEISIWDMIDSCSKNYELNKMNSYFNIENEQFDSTQEKSNLVEPKFAFEVARNILPTQAKFKTEPLLTSN